MKTEKLIEPHLTSRELAFLPTPELRKYGSAGGLDSEGRLHRASWFQPSPTCGPKLSMPSLGTLKPGDEDAEPDTASRVVDSPRSRRIKKAFRLIDKNRDGLISTADLVSFIAGDSSQKTIEFESYFIKLSVINKLWTMENFREFMTNRFV